MSDLTTEDTEDTERENDLQCEFLHTSYFSMTLTLSAWHALALAKQKLLHEAKSKLAEARDEASDLRSELEQLKEAYEDHKKVHDAASRLLVAINKQLPISCFLLVSSEYYRLKNAIYGREQTK